MLSSMTAFARKMVAESWGTLTWEMRSVNHRYLDISLRVPESFRPLEPMIRELLSKQLKRGKVDVTLKFQAGDVVPFDFKLNKKLLHKLAVVANEIKTELPQLNTNLTDLLNWQGVLQVEETAMDQVKQAALVLLDEAVVELKNIRQREGASLESFFTEKLAAMSEQVDLVEAKFPEVLQAERDALTKRFDELKLEFDSERFEQEMVWLAQKMDVAEELQRLQAHLVEVQRVIKMGGVVGRRLDFLMQELNREANTLSSKSVDISVTQAAIEMKVLIEQMREQVQNIE